MKKKNVVLSFVAGVVAAIGMDVGLQHFVNVTANEVTTTFVPVTVGTEATNKNLNLPSPDYEFVANGTEVEAWSYAKTVQMLDDLTNHSSIGSPGTPISIGANGTAIAKLRQECVTVVDNGFGLVRTSNVMAQQELNWYCNDSWPTQGTAVSVSKAPQNWDANHVKHYGDLGAIKDAFSGGWSCDYAGTAVGAPWAGVGKGHT
ncbi:MAG: hypothetical protein LBT37_02265 [Lactobacillaceae bacterium]|nr:hypothetical protein [Lactobacillaceae bacterium]